MRRLNASSPYFSSPATGWPAVQRMHPNLVRAAGMDRNLHQGRATSKELHRLEIGERLLATRVRLNRALAAHAQIGAQRHIDPLAPEIPGASNQRQIALLQLTLAQQRMQRA